MMNLGIFCTVARTELKEKFPDIQDGVLDYLNYAIKQAHNLSLSEIEQLQREKADAAQAYTKGINTLAADIQRLKSEKAELVAQSEAFKSVVQKLANIEHEHGGALQPCGQFAYRVKEYLFKEAAKVLELSPVQCLNQIKAEAVCQAVVASGDASQAIRHPAGYYHSEPFLLQYAASIAKGESNE